MLTTVGALRPFSVGFYIAFSRWDPLAERVCRDATYLFVEETATEPALRGNRFFVEGLRTLLVACREVTCVRLCADERNTHAIRIYEWLGFVRHSEGSDVWTLARKCHLRVAEASDPLLVLRRMRADDVEARSASSLQRGVAHTVARHRRVGLRQHDGTTICGQGRKGAHLPPRT